MGILAQKLCPININIILPCKVQVTDKHRIQVGLDTDTVSERNKSIFNATD